MTLTARPELAGTFGLVTTTHWLASAAGMKMLEAGGAASDAAAAGIVLDVVEPHRNGPLGDMPALTRPPRCRPVGFSMAESCGDRDMSMAPLQGGRHDIGGHVSDYQTPTTFCDAQLIEFPDERSRFDAAFPVLNAEVLVPTAHRLAPVAGTEIR